MAHVSSPYAALAPEILAELRAYILVHGPGPLAKAAETSEHVVTRGAAGLPIRRASATVLRMALEAARERAA